MPAPVASANHTESSGPIASRPSRTIAVSRANCATSPEAADAHNRAGDVGVPGTSVVGDRQSKRLVISPRGRQQLDAAVANAADGIGLIDGEPDGAVGGGCNCHRSIVRTGHAVLDEARHRAAPRNNSMPPPLSTARPSAALIASRRRRGRRQSCGFRHHGPPDPARRERTNNRANNAPPMITSRPKRFDRQG